VDRFYHCDSVTTLQDAVTKLYICVAEIKIKAELKDERGPTPITEYSCNNVMST